MVKKLKNKLLSLSLVGLMLIAFLAPVSWAVGSLPVYATPKGDACNALNQLDSSIDCSSTDAKNAQEQLSGKVGTVINVLSLAVGTVSVIMIIVGGFKYITSNGDSNSTKSAKDTIMYALIGLALVLMAQVIVRFVYSKAIN